MAEFKFLTDTHIPIAAIESLRRKGIDIVRSIEVGFEQNEADPVLLEYATREERVIITCDFDFEQHGLQWQSEGRDHASILYLNMAAGECQNVGLIVLWVELIFYGANPEIERFNQIWRPV